MSFGTSLKGDRFVSTNMKNHIYLTAEVLQVKNDIFQEAGKKFLFFKKMKITIYGVVIIVHEGIYEQRNIEIKVFQIWELKYGICCRGKNSSYVSVLNHEIRKWIPKKVLAGFFRYI